MIESLKPLREQHARHPCLLICSVCERKQCLVHTSKASRVGRFPDDKGHQPLACGRTLQQDMIRSFDMMCMLMVMTRHARYHILKRKNHCFDLFFSQPAGASPFRRFHSVEGSGVGTTLLAPFPVDAALSMR